MSEQVIEDARSVGISDEKIAEVVTPVATNAFTNYFAKTARVVVDFPQATPRGAA